MEWQHNRKGQLCSWESAGPGVTGAFSSAGSAPLFEAGPSVPTDVGALSEGAFGDPNIVDFGPEAGGAQGGIYSREPFEPRNDPYSGVGPHHSVGGGFDPSTIVKALPAIIGGGNQLVNMFRSSPTEKLIESGQQQMRGISKATGKAGKGQLNQYIQGRLSEPQQAAVERFKQQQRAYWNQYFAKAGIPVSSAMAEIEGKIEQDAQVYANQLLQQNFENSMKSLGLSNNSLVSQSYINAGLNSQIANSQAQAAEAIAKMAGIFFPGQTQQVY